MRSNWRVLRVERHKQCYASRTLIETMKIGCANGKRLESVRPVGC